MHLRKKDFDDDNIIFEPIDEIVLIPNKKKIVVSVKVEIDTGKVIGVDVRWYKLFAKDGKYDGKIKPTTKGICFGINLLEPILNILLIVYKKVYNSEFRG